MSGQGEVYGRGKARRINSNRVVLGYCYFYSCSRRLEQIHIIFAIVSVITRDTSNFEGIFSYWGVFSDMGDYLRQ